MRLWACDLNLHIVCLQETHMRKASQEHRAEWRFDGAADQLACSSYTAVWHRSETGHTHAGVGMLIRSDLLASGAVTVQKYVNQPSNNCPARCITARVRWSGHKIYLINAYLPSGDQEKIRDFITGTLIPVLRACPASYQPMLCGDFNFTDNPDLDRTDTAANPRYPERATAAMWKPLLEELQLQDAYRALHPQSRCYTFFSTTHVGVHSRLDRLYVSPATLQHTESCSIEGHAAISDHKPAVLHLRPAAPSSQGPGMKRLRLGPLSTAEGKQALRELLQELSADHPQDPGDHAAWLEWWLGFKHRLVQQVGRLAREHAARVRAASAARVAAQQHLDQALEALQRAGPDQRHAAIQQAAAARAALSEQVRAEAAPQYRASRKQWLHRNERPNPLMSKVFKPSSKSGHIPTLRAPNGGGLITHGPELAQQTVRFFADISKARPHDPAATQAVLEALRAQLQSGIGSSILPGDCETAGHTTVSAEEVTQAISASRAGTSPGPDGIPIELWRWCKEDAAPLLAAVLTAIGSADAAEQVPAWFAQGAVTAIYKGKGDMTLLGNYRPITLLNTDYRLLAKCLATRWAVVLGKAIGRHQTAFLPDRLIGENILFQQLLPAALRSQRTRPELGPANGAVAFLDFKKAYDTVSRPFLFQTMEAVGAGVGWAGMTGWARRLLAHTEAVAVVNGHVSDSAHWEAGVRQGCPLAPAMYLFVAWALCCWLHHKPAPGQPLAAPSQQQSPTQPPPQQQQHPLQQQEQGQDPELHRHHQRERLGLAILGFCIACVQYADDVQALLAGIDEASVRQLLAVMTTFALASGQELNVEKSWLLPVGHVIPVDLPEEVLGMKVVPSAKSLGISFSNEGLEPDGFEPEGADWTSLLGAVSECYSKIARLPLSMFGRAFAAAGYGISKLLYHAEFSPVPAWVTKQLHQITAKLVDRKLSPTGNALRRTRCLPGIPSQLLTGPPSQGGVGLMPWKQHITARRAMWGKRLLEGLAAVPILQGVVPANTPPWILAAAAILSHRRPTTHPALAFLATCSQKQPGQPSPAREMQCGALYRMAKGIRALGPPAVSAPTATPAHGSWYQYVPLWSHPQLRPELPLADRPQPYKATLHQQRATQPASQDVLMEDASFDQYGFSRLVPLMSTLGDLVGMADRLANPPALPHNPQPRYWSTQHDQSAYFDKVWPGYRHLSDFTVETRALVRSPQELCSAVAAMVRAMPAAWVAAARASLQQLQLPVPVSLCQEATVMALRSIAWQRPAAQLQQHHAPSQTQPDSQQLAQQLPGSTWLAPEFHPPRSHLHLFQKPLALTCKAATQLQLREWEVEVTATHLRVTASALQLAAPPLPAADVFVELAVRVVGGGVQVGLVPARPPPAPELIRNAFLGLRARLPTVWRLPWDNYYKETWWRLLLEGVPGAGGHRVALRKPCPCGWSIPAYMDNEAGAAAQRDHVFWHCRPARAVRALLSHNLPQDAQVLPQHLWLLQTLEGVHAGVWSVVALAALTAISKARSYMWALHCELLAARRAAAANGGVQLTIEQAFGLAPMPAAMRVVVTAAAADKAVAEMLGSVRDFVSLNSLPADSWGSIGQQHPFIGVRRLDAPAETYELVDNCTVPGVLVE